MFLEAVTLASLLGAVMPVQTGWRPISRPLQPQVQIAPALQHQTISYQSHIPEPSQDGCTLYKALFDQESPSQYVQYKAPIPDMKEFTLCMWHKFYNHSRDQPLFAYSSSHDRTRDVYSWVSNDVRSSYYMLAVMGQTMYRLNYPVRLHKWYHSCQSWNGRTGEWQIWINSERIGRGFHNLLVGKTIKGGGVATTGQEMPKNIISGYQDLYKPTGGLLGEVTLLQLYKAALTAGKAYTNHKHHHAHHFHHDDKLGEDDLRIIGIEPSAALPENPQPTQEYPFLRHGQLIPTLPIHELSAQRGQQQNSLNPQLNVLGTSIIGQGQENGYSLQQMRIYKRDQAQSIASPSTKTVVRRRIRPKRPKSLPPLDTDEEYEDTEMEGKTPFKRDVEKTDEDIKDGDKESESKAVLLDSTEKRDKRSNEENNKNIKDENKEYDSKDELLDSTEKREKRSNKENDSKTENKNEDVKAKNKREAEQGEKVQKKRTALLGDVPFGVIQGADLSGLFAGDGYILGQGGLKFSDDNNHHSGEEQVQMEPAEWEVRSIMAVCSGCSEDPFRKATLISWRETSKKLFSGVLYIPAVPECQSF
ncbi:pentraxin-related protein b6 [Lycorma delicatula]|uniref:pentraxin-related protein b6 n=1 Tax=Lycorma delicatula TaxID=130591 RepID=UPI003F513AB9